MDGKPYRLLFRIRPLHPVADMPGNEEMITGFEINLPAVIETQRGISRNEQDPLLRLLIVPETLGRGLAPGDDPLDPEGLRPQDLLNSLPGQLRENPVKQVVNGYHFRPLSPVVYKGFLHCKRSPESGKGPSASTDQGLLP
jgi:hypothetical protein